jgi:hypothetical protein
MVRIIPLVVTVLMVVLAEVAEPRIMDLIMVTVVMDLPFTTLVVEAVVPMIMMVMQLLTQHLLIV